MEDQRRKNSIDLQDRDFAVLRGLFESRIMTLQHIAVLYFDGKPEATKKRIQKLKAASLIAERPRRQHEPSILTLSRSGFETLVRQGKMSEYPGMNWAGVRGRLQVSDLTLRHELQVLDVRAAMTAAVGRLAGIEISEFSTYPALFEFSARPELSALDVVVKPDGFIRIGEQESKGDLFEHTFYLELDRSTETQDTLISRAACYVDYYRRGGLAIRNGRTAAEFKDFPFRTLIVMKTAERRSNTAERLLLMHPPILSQMWLTTFDEIVTDPLGAIWIRPIDYRDATTGTLYEPGRIAIGHGYRRQTEREAHVEKRIRKHQLLASEEGA